MADAVLQCPKCGTRMVSFQRSGIVLEECGRCRSVLLGRGDMERLVAREAAGSAMNGHQVSPLYEGRHRRD
jgi:Zn-finger nucleic acid-binding protein